MLWGLFAKQADYEVLGPAVAAHSRILLWCLPLTLVVLCCVLPMSLINQQEDRVLIEGGTAAAWAGLTWGHVVLDCFVSTLFMAFITREQLLLMMPNAFQGAANSLAPVPMP